MLTGLFLAYGLLCLSGRADWDDIALRVESPEAAVGWGFGRDDIACFVDPEEVVADVGIDLCPISGIGWQDFGAIGNGSIGIAVGVDDDVSCLVRC